MIVNVLEWTEGSVVQVHWVVCGNSVGTPLVGLFANGMSGYEELQDWEDKGYVEIALLFVNLPRAQEVKNLDETRWCLPLAASALKAERERAFWEW
jgi:hypothetical protein